LEQNSIVTRLAGAVPAMASGGSPRDRLGGRDDSLRIERNERGQLRHESEIVIYSCPRDWLHACPGLCETMWWLEVVCGDACGKE
jgi:hypothetical protein